MEKGILRTDIPAALKAGLIGAAAGLVVALIGRIPHVSIGTATCVCIATLRIEELFQTLKAKYTIVTHNIQQAARTSDHTAFLMMAEDRAGYLVEWRRLLMQMALSLATSERYARIKWWRGWLVQNGTIR
jgi:hypothetical protein